MSISLVSETPATTDPPVYVPPPLTQERKRELLDRWQRIESGELKPEPVAWPPAVEQLVREAEAAMPPRSWITRAGYYLWTLLSTGRGRSLPRLTPEGRRLVEQGIGLDYLYGGHVVVGMDTPSGYALLAVGEEEFGYLLDVASDEFRNRTRVEHLWDTCLWKLGSLGS